MNNATSQAEITSILSKFYPIPVRTLLPSDQDPKSNLYKIFFHKTSNDSAVPLAHKFYHFNTNYVLLNCPEITKELIELLRQTLNMAFSNNSSLLKPSKKYNKRYTLGDFAYTYQDNSLKIFHPNISFLKKECINYLKEQKQFIAFYTV